MLCDIVFVSFALWAVALGRSWACCCPTAMLLTMKSFSDMFPAWLASGKFLD